MSILVSGVLVNPLNQPIPNASITLAAIDNSFTLLSGVSVTAPTNERGEYEFILEPSNYSVNVSMDGHHTFYGAITVTEITSPSSLNVLLKQNVMNAELPPNYTTFFQQIQMQVALVSNEAVQAKNLAVIKAAEAAQSANDAKNAVHDFAITSGELTTKSIYVPVGQVFTGATYISENNRVIGFTVPSGFSGASSYTTAFIQPSAELIKELVGSTVKLSIIADVTENFIQDKPLRGIVQVSRNGSIVEDGTLERNEQIGTRLYREATYVVTADDTKFGLVLQLLANSAAVNVTHSLRLRSVNMSIEKWMGGPLNTGADALLDQRLGLLKSDVIDDTKRRLQVSSVTTGDMFSLMSSSGQVFSGATYRLSDNGKIIGFDIPAGQSGKLTYVTAFIPVDKEIITQLAGSQIRLILKASVSGAFSRKLLSPLAVQIRRGATVVNDGVIERSEIVGNSLYREVLYTVTSADTAFGVVVQIANSDNVESELSTFEIVATSFKVESYGNTGVLTGSDPLINMRLGLLAENISTETDVKFGNTSVTSGEYYSKMFASYSTLNGAIPIRRNGNVVGFTIPAGQSGKTSYITTFIPMSYNVINKLVGSVIRVMVIADVTTDFLKKKSFTSIVAQVMRAGKSVVVGTLVRNEQIGNKLYREVVYTVTSEDTAIGVTTQIANSDSVADIDCSYEVTSTAFRIESYVGGGVTTGTDVMVAMQIPEITTNDPVIVSKTVNNAGGADFQTIPAAIAAITDASALKQYVLNIGGGPYSENNWYTKDHVHLRGDVMNRTVIDCTLPNDATSDQIKNTQPFWCNTTTTLENLTVLAKNMRYAMHADSSGNIKDGTMNIINCHFEHRGNASAINNMWASMDGIGSGVSSGQVVNASNSTFVGLYAAYSAHDNVRFAKAAALNFNNCIFLSPVETVTIGSNTYGAGRAINLESLGALQQNTCTVINSIFNGDLYHNNAAPWLLTTLEDQPADHTSWRYFGSGNSPAVFKLYEPGRCLKIDAGPNATISATGSAVTSLFGRQVFSRPGRGGLRGYIYGWADISGMGVGLNRDVFITKLGQRLGDCTTTNKTLTIVVNDGLPITIVFNQNYTSVNNADVLNVINGALGSTATASEWKSATYRPQFTDEEKTLLNNTAVGIEMGMAVAYDTMSKRIRKMTSADPISVFAGIAWEDIAPGDFGRVKTCGYLDIGDVLRSENSLFSFGDTFSVGAIPGLLVKGGSQAILFAIRPDAVRVGNIKI